MATKVTFTLSSDVVADATEGILLGEFNNWDHSSGITLKKQKDGSMKAVASLESGKTYQYRYLLNDGRWVNDSNADNYAHADGFYVENCVITVPAEEVKAPKVKKPTVVKEKAIPAAKVTAAATDDVKKKSSKKK